MNFDYPSLARYARELRQRLVGAQVCFASSSADELSLQFGTDPPSHLRLRLGAAEIMLAPGKTARLPNSDGAERYLTGSAVVELQTLPRDRALELRLQRRDTEGEPNYGSLHLELVPPRYRAVLVGERHGKILGGWSLPSDPRRFSPGRLYHAMPGPTRVLPGHDTFEEFLERLNAMGSTVEAALRKALAALDRRAAREICRRADVSAEAAVHDIDRAEAEDLWEAAKGLYALAEGDNCGPWIVRRGQHRLVSVIPPCTDESADLAPNLVEAVLTCCADQAAGQERSRSRDRKGSELRRAIKSLRRLRDAVRGDLEESGRADELERQGNVLLARQPALAPGQREVVVDDIFSQGAVAIAVDPRLTAAENAAKLLKTATRYRRRAEVLPERLRNVEEQLRCTEQLLERLDEGIEESEMSQWREEIGAGGRETGSGGAQGGGRKRERAHPRRYRTSSGWVVWAGRNNRENDMLTHRVAAQNDIWFHAYGYTGSHVVLRRDGRRQEPSARTLEEAAAVAAYWSKGRTASKVPVVYTLVKYVSNPRGGTPGLAVLKRERTIMVRPELLPEEGSEEGGGH
ncbi:MAG: NFACT RNA binding domain-containing protein [Candidatus Latescibacterota bacterium]|nr:NFACT RNA binding domain-containing protein [Candidatus Latescibacterota bacterium]